MSAKLFSKPKLAWTGILLVLFLALIFLPGVQRRIFDRTANRTGNSSSKPEASATSPGSFSTTSRQVSGTGAAGSESSNHDIIITVLEAANGKGIPGASVSCVSSYGEPANGAELLTDKNGHCTVSVPPQGKVTARAAGFVPHTKAFSLIESPDEYTFRLERGTTIGGIVRSEEEKPIRDVKLALVFSIADSFPRTLPVGETVAQSIVVTDATGHWNCGESPSHPDSIRIDLTHPEYATARYTTDTAPLTTAFDPIPVQRTSLDELKAVKAIFVMKYGVLVSGAVLDESGIGIEGAVLSQIERTLALAKATTANDGRFWFASPKPGAITLVAQAKGYAPARQDVTVAAKMQVIEFRLQKGAIVAGHIVDENGKPVASAQISTAPGRGDPDYFPWSGTSDAQGRFLWDSAPVNSLHYLVRAAGYLSASPFFLLDPGKDNEIKLQKVAMTRLTGTVVDSKTKKPIEKFKVLALMAGSAIGAISADGQDGGFALTLPDYSMSSSSYSLFNIRVEAPGYQPDTSRTVDSKNGDQNLEFALEPGKGLSGTVVFAGGEPVAGAKVYLSGATISNGAPFPAAMYQAGVLRASGAPNQAVVTDEDGKFTFDLMPEAHSIMVTHEKGFVALTPNKVGANSTITLQPWGRIEGTAKIGKDAAANQNVFLSTFLPLVDAPAYGVSVKVNTDDEGKFVFSMIPPGEYRLYIGMVRAASTLVTVHAGETANVRLGGVGRPVIGHLLILGADAPIDWKLYSTPTSSALALKLPEPRVSDTRDPKYREWARTDEAKNRARAAREYGLTISTDGAFRAEDVLAGIYILTFTLRTAAGRQELTQEIIVPETPAGRSDAPLDLGAITLQVPAKK